MFANSSMTGRIKFLEKSVSIAVILTKNHCSENGIGLLGTLENFMMFLKAAFFLMNSKFYSIYLLVGWSRIFVAQFHP